VKSKRIPTEKWWLKFVEWDSMRSHCFVNPNRYDIILFTLLLLCCIGNMFRRTNIIAQSVHHHHHHHTLKNYCNGCYSYTLISINISTEKTYMRSVCLYRSPKTLRANGSNKKRKICWSQSGINWGVPADKFMNLYYHGSRKCRHSYKPIWKLQIPAPRLLRFMTFGQFEINA